MVHERLAMFKLKEQERVDALRRQHRDYVARIEKMRRCKSARQSTRVETGHTTIPERLEDEYEPGLRYPASIIIPSAPMEEARCH